MTSKRAQWLHTLALAVGVGALSYLMTALTDTASLTASGAIKHLAVGTIGAGLSRGIGELLSRVSTVAAGSPPPSSPPPPAEAA